MRDKLEEQIVYGIIFVDEHGKVQMTMSNGTIRDYAHYRDTNIEARQIQLRYDNPRLNDNQEDIMIELAERLSRKPEIPKSELTEIIRRLNKAGERK